MKHSSSFKLWFFVLGMAGFSVIASGQNLVPNGSFEEGINCPTQVGNVTLECADWYASLLSDPSSEPTPDWFHTCSDVDLLSPPEVVFGFQEPSDGQGYIGLIGYASGISNSNYREIVAVELTEPMVINNEYLITFDVSSIAPVGTSIFSNKFGFNFATHPFYELENFPINTSHYYLEEIIGNEWVQVAQTFIADSTYSYLHLGNFFDDENTQLDPNTADNTRSYYAIDNVSIEQILSSSTEVGERKSTISIYPNPTFDLVTISINPVFLIESVFLCGMDGRIIQHNKVGNQNESISLDLSDCAKGIYIVKVETIKNTYHETIVKI
ncbi:MAG: T9SS type A sorting domain-containing protein [Cryomorphaceae bacterium]|nr:T9SS type A sorting domain-containing protein [Flavobacteriales bacterium]